MSWISFTGTYAITATNEPAYSIPAGLLLAAASVRLSAWVRVRRRGGERT